MRGMAAIWEQFLGPGWTRAETALVFAGSVAAAVALPVWAAQAGAEWGFWRSLLAALLALDIVGGAIALNTAPGRRQYGTKPPLARMGFVAVHLHPFLTAWAFGASDWVLQGAVGYGWLVGFGAVLLAAPTRLKRPLAAFSVVMGGFLVTMLATPAGWAWFLPCLYAKLHLGVLSVGDESQKDATFSS